MENKNTFDYCFNEVMQRKDKENIALFDELCDVVFDSMIENEIVSEKTNFAFHGLSRKAKTSNKQPILILNFGTETDNCGICSITEYYIAVNKNANIAVKSSIKEKNHIVSTKVIDLDADKKNKISTEIKNYLMDNYSKNKYEDIELSL